MRELDSVVNVKCLIFVTLISASNLTGVLCNKKYNVLVLMRGENYSYFDRCKSRCKSCRDCLNGGRWKGQ